ncbi:2OG-Fe dioxygenase family protein [Streptomyces sp. NPDC005065]|uniref:2OG-Fe dioxygenase family protein n=1 Tax=unclassified Streptomyces TaxID=2593676 RepID=UPI0033B051EA
MPRWTTRLCSSTWTTLVRSASAFVAQVLINREGITWGESQLYDRERTPIFRTTLLEPLESIVIDDRRVFHGVSGVTPTRG